MLKLLLIGGLVVLLGFIYGPPSYVVFTEHQAVIDTSYGQQTAYLAWHINRWIPIHAMAELVWYAPTVDTTVALTQEQLKQASVPFVIPGGFFKTYLWWLLPPIFWIGQKVMGIGFFALRQVQSHKRNYYLAERRNTIIGYEHFLKQTKEVPYKPFRLRRKAKQARQQLYDSYIQSLSRSSLDDDERIFNGAVAKMLAFNRDHEQRFLPLQLNMEAGVFALIRGEYKRFMKFEGYFEERMNQAAKQWLLEVHGSGVASMSELYENWDARARSCAKAILTAKQWRPLTDLREGFKNYVADSLFRVLGRAQSQRQRDDVVRHAEAYLTYSVYRYMPVDTRLNDYEQEFKRLIGKRIAQSMSALFPQEISTNGVKPDLFLNPSFRNDSHFSKLNIELIFDNKVMPDGMPVLKTAFYLALPGEPPQRLHELEARLDGKPKEDL